MIYLHDTYLKNKMSFLFNYVTEFFMLKKLFLSALTTLSFSFVLAAVDLNTATVEQLNLLFLRLRRMRLSENERLENALTGMVRAFLYWK